MNVSLEIFLSLENFSSDFKVLSVPFMVELIEFEPCLHFLFAPVCAQHQKDGRVLHCGDMTATSDLNTTN